MNKWIERLWNVSMAFGILWIFTQWDFAGIICAIGVALTLILPLPDSHFKNTMR